MDTLKTRIFLANSDSVPGMVAESRYPGAPFVDVPLSSSLHTQLLHQIVVALSKKLDRTGI